LKEKMGTGIRIAYIVKEFPRISETFILNEILELERLGFEVTIFTRTSVSNLPPHNDFFHLKGDILLLGADNPKDLLPKLWDNILVFLSRPRVWINVLRKVRKKKEKSALRKFWIAGRISRHILKKKIDHVHAHFATHNTKIARLVSNLTGIDYSFTAHAKDIWVKSTPPEIKSMIDNARFAVTICRYNMDYLCSLTAAYKKIHLIYNGLDLSKFPYPATRGNKQNARIEILAVGRLVPKKGFAVLIQACKILQSSNVNFSCRIVGDGPERDDLKDLISTNRLSDVFFLEGPCTQEILIRQYLSHADIFVMPSIITENGDRDGIPTVILEAMAMGIPVAATSVAGIPEVVIDSQTGVLIEPGSAAALAEAIVMLTENNELRRRLGQNGSALVRERFDRKSNVKLLARLFGECVR
jgi:glycosyltransferase involved in cell wall biosynthesis